MPADFGIAFGVICILVTIIGFLIAYIVAYKNMESQKKKPLTSVEKSLRDLNFPLFSLSLIMFDIAS